MPKCEHGLTSKECYVCASPKHAEQAEKQVVFKIYKPTLPRGAIPNVRDAELPWVYDQDPSSGNVASMWVTPVKATPQPQREWVGLTLEDKKEYLAQDFGGSRADAMDWADKRLKEKNCG